MPGWPPYWPLSLDAGPLLQAHSQVPVREGADLGSSWWLCADRHFSIAANSMFSLLTLPVCLLPPTARSSSLSAAWAGSGGRKASSYPAASLWTRDWGLLQAPASLCHPRELPAVLGPWQGPPAKLWLGADASSCTHARWVQGASRTGHPASPSTPPSTFPGGPLGRLLLQTWSCGCHSGPIMPETPPARLEENEAHI